MSFLNQIKQRRTIYAIGRDLSLDHLHLTHSLLVL